MFMVGVRGDKTGVCCGFGLHGLRRHVGLSPIFLISRTLHVIHQARSS